MNISIDLDINVHLLILKYDVSIGASNKDFIELFNQKIKELANQYEMADIVKINNIEKTREAYKELGKSPSSYRNAAEAMLRRIVKSSSLYFVNNVVDINNYFSISTGYSIGSYDYDKIVGDIVLKKAREHEKYEGIGKDLVNIAFLPTLYDNIGPFGNPTSDSKRTMINENTTTVISVIYAFSTIEQLKELAIEYSQVLEKYCGINKIESIII